LKEKKILPPKKLEKLRNNIYIFTFAASQYKICLLPITVGSSLHYKTMMILNDATSWIITLKPTIMMPLEWLISHQLYGKDRSVVVPIVIKRSQMF
jgi:hypothetical protein